MADSLGSSDGKNQEHTENTKHRIPPVRYGSDAVVGGGAEFCYHSHQSSVGVIYAVAPEDIHS